MYAQQSGLFFSSNFIWICKENTAGFPLQISALKLIMEMDPSLSPHYFNSVQQLQLVIVSDNDSQLE